jgi:uroporphyrinogen III methyltransferase/synthase
MGTAYLVGAGPGDPKLLTRRGAELLRRADVVLHDALVDPGLLALAPRAEIIDVGRRAGESRWLTQERINRLLIELTRRHGVVVRLKGGDPLVFGRGGEEALALAQAGVLFEIVPGVTAGVGALAHAGIPLTHRGLAASAVFVTAHDREDPEREPEWRAIAAMGGTVVVYMGGARIRAVTERLIRLGRAPETPAAVVESGTLPGQRVIEGRLDEIADRAGELTGPAVIVVGEVARLRERLDWVRPGPLAGRSIVVARARSQRSWIARALRELGASVVEFPSVRSVAAPDAARVPAAVAALEGKGAIVFTGAAAVRESMRALRRAGLDARALAGLRLAAVGRETIAALRRAGLRCDVPVRSYLPIRVAAALRRGAGPLEELPVLLVRDGQETSALGEGLAAAGADVRQIEVATRIVDAHARVSIERGVSAGSVDAIVLPSSSAVEALVGGGLAVPDAVSVIAIGPATAATAGRLGLPAARVPSGAGVDALVAELVAAFAAVSPSEGTERPRASASSD